MKTPKIFLFLLLLVPRFDRGQRVNPYLTWKFFLSQQVPTFKNYFPLYKTYSVTFLAKLYPGHAMFLPKCLGFVFIASGIWFVSFPLSVRESWPFVLIPLPGKPAFFLWGLSPCSVPIMSHIPVIQHLLIYPGSSNPLYQPHPQPSDFLAWSCTYFFKASVSP